MKRENDRELESITHQVEWRATTRGCLRPSKHYEPLLKPFTFAEGPLRVLEGIKIKDSTN
jgi:hypothetical protein